METETFFKWTKVTTIFTGTTYRRKYRIPYRFCLACIVIITFLLLTNARNWMNVEWHNRERAVIGNIGSSVAELILKNSLLKPDVMLWGSSPILVLFTSFEYSSEKEKVHGKVLKLWSSWSKNTIRTVVYTSNGTVDKTARAAGWQVRPVTRVNPECHGPPMLKGMFSDAFENFRSFLYGYANADIVFGEGLVKTIKFIQSKDLWNSKPLLIVGRRYNFPFDNDSDVPLDSPADVKRMTKLGGQPVPRFTEYFFTNIMFPWNRIAPVSIGRPYVVAAVIGHAVKKRIDIIDATNTIESVHLTTTDGLYNSWQSKGVFCNKRVLENASFAISVGFGHCECASLATYTDTTGHIQLMRKHPDRKICIRKRGRKADRMEHGLF